MKASFLRVSQCPLTAMLWRQGTTVINSPVGSQAAWLQHGSETFLLCTWAKQVIHLSELQLLCSEHRIPAPSQGC